MIKNLFFIIFFISFYYKIYNNVTFVTFVTPFSIYKEKNISVYLNGKYADISDKGDGDFLNIAGWVKKL